MASLPGRFGAAEEKESVTSLSGGAKIAYFSMEIALEPQIPTYSGGLGMLAGDTLRSAADLAIPMVAVTLLHRRGYFIQRLDPRGSQSELPVGWEPERALEPVEPVVSVNIEGRTVHVRAWRYEVRGIAGLSVSVYLLDTALDDNSPWDRSLTDQLYGGDAHYRLCQEVVLGLGGARMLRAVGFHAIEKYHMNEGHSALLILDLLESSTGERGIGAARSADVDRVRPRCVFTTHTPVPAGHDRFSNDLVRKVLGEDYAAALEASNCLHHGELNMTYLALRASDYINGVAMQHGEVSRGMFPNYPISAITNGVHAGTWTAPPMGELYDRHIPAWRRDETYLRYAKSIPVEEILEAHALAKAELLDEVRQATGVELAREVMTLGFARRASTYKRADLFFANIGRLKWIARNTGPLQVIFGGKAHPRDEPGKQLIQRIFAAAEALGADVKVVYVENYDMRWGQLLTSGVDLWMNTPQIPQEASGTSGMKAAINGVPSFSVLDGWWVEGHLEGVTGWSIGHGRGFEEDFAAEVDSLYDKLESLILPTFYGRPLAYGDVMRSAIALNGSFFNTRRMIFQYVNNAYFPEWALKKALRGVLVKK